jgi:hypothetical protein
VSRGVVDLQVDLSQVKGTFPQVEISPEARGCNPHHLIKGFSMSFQVSFLLLMHGHGDLGFHELRDAFEVVRMTVSTHDEIEVCGGETVFLHARQEPSEVFEMANIDEGSKISVNNIAIAIILNGVFPRVMEEALLYDHGIEIPLYPSPRKGLRPKPVWL